MLEHMNIMYSMCQNKFLLHFKFILKVQQLKVCIKLKKKNGFHGLDHGKF